MMYIPAPALQALERLHKAGFAAFVVGGCVRDSLLGNTPGDWDITTAARPEQVHRALSGLTVLDTGLKHGTVTAVIEDPLPMWQVTILVPSALPPRSLIISPLTYL